MANSALTSLLLRCDGGNGSTVVVDSGPNSLSPNDGTASPSITTALSVSGGASLFFQADDALHYGPHAAFAFQAGDFTMEAWVAYGFGADVFSNGDAGAQGWKLRINASGKYVFSCNPSPFPTVTLTSTTSAASYTWTHIAVTRSGTTLRLFVNGVLEATAEVDAAALLTASSSMFNIGGNLQGYFDLIRVQKGEALYTSDFTPPAAMPLLVNASVTSGIAISSDTFQSPATISSNASLTSLLLRCDGANGSTTIIDDGPNALVPTTPTGSPVISTAQSKQGGASLRMPGASSVNYAAHAGFAFGTGDLTIEAWVYRESVAGSDPEIIGRDGTWSSGHWGINANDGAGGKYQFLMFNASPSILLTSTTSVIYNAWTHIAVTRQGNTFRLFVNGILEATATSSASISSAGTDKLRIGNRLTGYLDLIRIQKGEALYTSNFTPPLLFPKFYFDSVTSELQVASSLLNNLRISGGASDGLRVSESLLATWQKELAESIALTVIAKAMLSASSSVASEVVADDAAAAAASLQARAQAAWALSGELLGSARLRAAALDALRLVEVEALARSPEFAVWVANLMTSAHSRYTQFPFDSFAAHGGKTWGCKDNGVFELDGETDGGDPIPWAVVFPEMDFGTNKLKRVPFVYFGLKTTGQLVLKVVADDAVWFYNVVPSGRDARVARAKLGRGLDGRYWKFELASDTERMELDSINYEADQLSRRV